MAVEPQQSAPVVYTKLLEVILDGEVALNNRPLRYMEDDDVQLPVLTPNSLRVD